MNRWYEKAGEFGDVVISTRIRLARNIAKYPFPCKLDGRMKTEVVNDIKRALESENLEIYNFSKIDVSATSRIDAGSLVESHLISPEFVQNSEGKTVFLSDDESISIMANEEDHIRLQVMKEGLDLMGAYEIADRIDNILDEKLSFAFNDQLGYLTQCPTNLGTGMRASVMLHLPALGKVKAIERISSKLLKLGLTIRGFYGEGTEPVGDIYQISNQVTLGISERTAIKNLSDITMQIINQERSCRKELLRDIRVIDTITRSLGILKTASIISCDEFMRLISNVRLGLNLNLIVGTSYDEINAMIIALQPNMLQRNAREELDSRERDKKRAEIIKEKMKDAHLV